MLVRLRRLALLLALSLLAGGSSAANAASAQPLKAIWGPTKLANLSSAFPVYEQLGVDVVQLQLSWNQVAPARPLDPTDPADPTYLWPSAGGVTGIDYAIAQASAHGMQIALLVKGTPWWAVQGAAPLAQVANKPPSNVQDYADFLTAASARYPQVHRWMIWGETNRQAVWNGGPTAYANLLDAAYGALKPSAPDPDTVVGGMTFTYGETSPATFLAGMKRSNGTRPRLDEYGHNPFTRRCPDVAQGPDHLQAGARDISDVDTLSGEVRGAFGPSTKLWLSEFTVSSDRANRATTFYVSREDQAAWLTRAFRIAGSHPDWVSGLGWFSLLDEPAAISDGLTTGLMTYEGVAKPAFAAYAAETLDGSQAAPACPQPPPPPPPPPGPAPPPTPPTPPGDSKGLQPGDGTPPRLTVKAPPKTSPKQAVARGVVVQLRCDERCGAEVALLVPAKLAKRLGLKARGKAPVVVASGRGTGNAGKQAKVVLRFVAAAKKHVKKLRTLTATLRVTVVDAAGNRRVSSTTLRLKR